jgi:arsenate reductase
MAEALLREYGGATFEPYSAGTNPTAVNPLTVRVLADAGIDASRARSKSVDGFLGGRFDYVVTVCDDAAESCPVIPGARKTLHWSIPDPAAAGGTEDERLAVFRATLADIRGRVAEFIPLAVRNRDARVVGGPNSAGAR